ncbi:hypothetical protein [Chlorogloeopsis sp. ULAP02]|uniref:hypothetical protein n=1 Tax=Chlorogloeopsis sp. ULAP02 TaxID=3107926 RepID=UPI0031361596
MALPIWDMTMMMLIIQTLVEMPIPQVLPQKNFVSGHLDSYYDLATPDFEGEKPQPYKYSGITCE